MEKNDGEREGKLGVLLASDIHNIYGLIDALSVGKGLGLMCPRLDTADARGSPRQKRQDLFYA